MIFDFTFIEWIAIILMLGGAVFFCGSAIGMLRLPDFYTRMHASGNSETLGCMLSFAGLIVYECFTIILSKAAYKGGHKVWTLKDMEKEEEKNADIHH